MDTELNEGVYRSLDNAETAISVKDFDLWYGDFQALKNIDLKIPRNRATAFIGPSGCGKSTLLRTFNRMCDFKRYGQSKRWKSRTVKAQYATSHGIGP